MTRWPVRLRLTGVFVVVMSCVLLVIGLFLYYRTRQNLDDAIDQALRAREGNLVSVAGSASPRRRLSIPQGERFAQVLAPDGEVRVGRPGGTPSLLTASEVRRASGRVMLFERHEHTRLLAGPTTLQGQPAVAVVASSLADRERALEGLGGALLIGGPLALLLAAGIAYGVAAGALAPVEAMRRRAEGISRADPDAGLPVPVARDEIGRLGETLNAMLRRLADTSAAERSFIAKASHELRTPVAALRAELELAVRHESTPDGFRAALQAAIDDADRLTAVTDELLTLARSEDGKLEFKEDVDIDDLLSDVAEMMRPAAREQDRDIEARPSGLRVRGDRVELGRAVRNLTENALIHGSGAILLGADPADDATRVQIWVLDEGRLAEGAAPERMFDRFVRGPGTAERPGAGLGLSIVSAVALAHGGTAVLAPEPRGGVRASITIPAGVA